MKKTVILGAMLLSTVAFARGYNQENTMGQNMENGARGNNKFANLSEEQVAKLQALKTEHLKENQEEKLEIEGLNIEIEKLLAEENVDWNAVNANVQQLVKLEAALELEMLKNHEEVKELLGDDAPMLAFGKGGRGQGRGAERQGKEMRNNGEREGKSSSFRGMGKDRENDNFQRGEGRGNRDNDEFRGKQANRGENAKGDRENREGFGRYSDLTDEQIAQIKEIKDAKNTDRNKLQLEIASVQNDIKKLLIADDIDWNAVEAKINEKSGHKVVMKISNYETREAIEDITGKEMIAFGQKGGRGKGMQQGRGMRAEYK